MKARSKLRWSGRFGSLLACSAVALALMPAALAQTPAESAAAPATLTSDADIERFLREAKIVRQRSAPKGVTNSLRVTLSDGAITHDAHVQTVDERKTSGPSAQGQELNFRDNWGFNIAGYKLDRLIGMNLVPVSVERQWRGGRAAFTWWVDDVIMDEGDRYKKKVMSPRPAEWNEQMQMVRVFDQLIYNMDRNLGNFLITKDWQLWAIDHTRAFRLHKSLKTPANITRCDRAMYEGLKRLDKPTLKREMGDYLSDWEIDAMLARRDLIVEQLDKSPTALFDRRDGRGQSAIAQTDAAKR